MTSADMPLLHDLSPGFCDVMSRAPVPVLVKNAEGFYIFANSAAEQFLGYGAGQLGGKHIDEISADDPVWLRSEWERFKTEQVWMGTLRFHRPDGALVSACLNAFMATTQSGAGAYIALLRRAPEPPRQLLAQPHHTEPGYDPLTLLQRRLLQLLAEGFSDRDLASILGLTEWAVTQELMLLMQKLRVRSRTAACIAAMKAHLIF